MPPKKDHQNKKSEFSRPFIALPGSFFSDIRGFVPNTHSYLCASQQNFVTKKKQKILENGLFEGMLKFFFVNNFIWLG